MRQIVPMEKTHWVDVAEIYTQALKSGTATFNSICPSWEEWNNAHIKVCRFVVLENDQVVGWAALSHTSSRPPYWGVVEVSIYIDQHHQHQGIGGELLPYLIAQSKEAGFWSLYVSIFSSNQSSIALHQKCGFRTIGYRERIAKDIFGNWQDTTLMENRLT